MDDGRGRYTRTYCPAGNNRLRFGKSSDCHGKRKKTSSVIFGDVENGAMLERLRLTMTTKDCDQLVKTSLIRVLFDLALGLGSSLNKCCVVKMTVGEAKLLHDR